MSDSKNSSFDDLVGGGTPSRRTTRPRTSAPSGTGGRRQPQGYQGRRYVEPNRFWNYPRPNQGPVRRWLPSWRFLLASFLLACVAGVGTFVYAYSVIDVPNPEDVALADTTTVYFADGETEMGKFATVNRHIIDTSTLPDHVGNAIVASEDQRFYTNVGIDPIGIVRAFVNNIKGGARQGGSTITQQYVERYYTGQTDGYIGKAKEAILAIKIDRLQSKDDILGNYMNTIYFGRGANGIEQAAQVYFGKPAAELTISESALIAGIIPSPSNWDPAVDPERAKSRWSRTLGLMVDNGFITDAERAAAVFPETKEMVRTDSLGGPNGYLLAMARAELRDKAGLTDEEIDTGGYQVVTTVDPRLQEAAVRAAQSLPDDHAPNLEVGMVSLDNATGGILALYGGPDYVSVPHNSATQSVAQSGSTFKVFALAAALENGVNLGDTFPSASPMTFDDGTADGYTVRNYDHRNRGQISLLEATKHSVNTSYVQLNQEIGPDATAEMAVRLGLPEQTRGLDPYLSNVLGSASPHVIDTARAYSTIANGGQKTSPHILDQVTTATQNTIYTSPTGSEKVLDRQVAADVTYAMTQVTQPGGTGATAGTLGRPVAGKTGSSQNYKSAWFAGFVPQMTTAVALYQPGPEGQEEEITPFGGVNPVAGGTWPATVWTTYMLEAVKDLPVQDFPSPSKVHNTRPAPTPTETESPEPTETPTEEPTEEPTETPTEEPTPTDEPAPTEEPTETPTQEPADPSPEQSDAGENGDADPGAASGPGSGHPGRFGRLGSSQVATGASGLR